MRSFPPDRLLVTQAGNVHVLTRQWGIEFYSIDFCLRSPRNSLKSKNKKQNKTKPTKIRETMAQTSDSRQQRIAMPSKGGNMGWLREHPAYHLHMVRLRLSPEALQASSRWRDISLPLLRYFPKKNGKVSTHRRTRKTHTQNTSMAIYHNGRL